MTIEEKAKAYDRAIEIAKKINNEHQAQPFDVMTRVFPELKESEGEKIRKHLISYFKSQIEARRDDSQEVLCTYNKWIAWLEKQGKVPVTIDIDKMVEDYSNNNERGNEEFGKPVNCMIRAYRLGITDTLSILNLENQDEQKPVISDDAIREGIAHFGITQYQIDNWLKNYVDVEKQGEKPQGKSALETAKEEKVDNQNCAKPADKVKPKFKVGDKIKLAKESTYPAREIIAIKNDAYYFDKLVHLPFCYQDEWELVEQKSTWNKEDEETALGIEQLCNCASLLNISPDKVNKVKQWLKSFKERVQPQQQWKPSEEQMNALNDVISSRDIKYDVLSELWKDLKQL